MASQFEIDLNQLTQLPSNLTRTSVSSLQDLHFPRNPMSGYNKIVSDEMFKYFETFTRQGFKDGVNVSLMSVTCWDFVKCLSGFIHRMCGPVSLISASLATSWKNSTYPYLDYMSLFAGYVAYVLTTYISVERCLCVTQPISVKSMLTPKLTLVIVISVSVLVFMNYFVVYLIYEIVLIYSLEFNATIASYTYSSFYLKHQHVVKIYFKSTEIIIPTSSFIILCVSSVITVKTLQQSKMFLGGEETHQSLGKRRSGFSRTERQVTKMLLAAIIVNICYLFLRINNYVGHLVEPDFYTLRKYHNFCLATARCLYVLDYTNASIHFFIHLSQSSKFAATFSSFFAYSSKKT